jgi:hypothetical protein
VSAVGVEAALDYRPHQGAEREAVAGAHQVDGVAHERDSHRAPLQDKAGELVGVESLKPRPQADVGRVGRLGLHADEVLDHLQGGQRLAAQQQLPFEQRAVERSRA